MHHPFAFSVSTVGPELPECEIFAWIIFGISLTVVAIFVCCSWFFFHDLKVTIPEFCLLVFHPRVGWMRIMVMVEPHFAWGPFFSWP
jgi:hypothetical protein